MTLLPLPLLWLYCDDNTFLVANTFDPSLSLSKERLAPIFLLLAKVLLEELELLRFLILLNGELYTGHVYLLNRPLRQDELLLYRYCRWVPTAVEVVLPVPYVAIGYLDL